MLILHRNVPGLRAAAIALLAAASGCGRDDCEPRVTGATPSQAAQIESTFASFQAALSADLHLCVPKITVGPVQGHWEGEYGPWSKKIRIEHTGDRILEHELCHAVDYQNDLDLDLFDPGLAADVYEHNEQNEVFASVCEDAFYTARLTETGCPHDDGDLRAVQYVGDLFPGSDSVVLEPPVAFEALHEVRFASSYELLVDDSSGTVLLQGDSAPMYVSGLFQGAALEWDEDDISRATRSVSVGDDLVVGDMTFSFLTGDTFRRSVVREGNRYHLASCPGTNERNHLWPNGEVIRTRVMDEDVVLFERWLLP